MSPETSTIAESAQVATEFLDRTRALVVPELESAAQRLCPELRSAVVQHLAGGGKCVRAGLVLLTAMACGGDEGAALDGATAIELVHNFSLIHDDVIDGDVERRHRPTMWASHGVNQAIVAGDALATLAFQILLEVPSRERVSAVSMLADATQAMIAGQAQDMALERRDSATLDECLEMVAGKTAALLRCASCLGPVLSGAPDSTVSAMWEFGHHLGIAFQAVDDVLGIWGEPDVTGKPVGSDLRSFKKTLPVCIATSMGVELWPSSLDRGADGVTDAEVTEMRERLEACGARRATNDLTQRHLDDALAALHRVKLDASARELLIAVANYVVDRDR